MDDRKVKVFGGHNGGLWYVRVRGTVSFQAFLTRREAREFAKRQNAR